MNVEWHAAWRAALDAMEADVARIERLARGAQEDDEQEPWTPPAGLGPLPPELKARAEELLARQQAATHDVAVALGHNRRHAAFAARVESGDPGAPRPGYIDHAA
ncbi:hypothetical protein Val02_77200 [Virgisporangium aliadipatigenens]|uniref:Uncharacterized protein n=1 Tax=Virgisporangium aliadipatigenens TaxID=741659 RepID=A0A8J3YSE2_9ACTN|nr:hypothetical protein [Virgisporangium aliadipatigenens]GIJ50834.1 hypothetical protein Val02_77200 [Virgisporangium aliadipatigenens]